MTQAHTFPTPIPTIKSSGRTASDAYRESIAFCEDFTGLEEGADRYKLLLLVKKVGKHGGFTPRMIQLLDYYMAFTRDVDWEEGSRPVVYQSISRTALDMGVTERQIQKLEKALFSVGAITWNDSGNHKRYGQRHPESGRILYAFGVELTPLASIVEKLEEILQDKQLYDAAWMETKRQVSWYRRQICATLREWQEEGASNELLRKFSERYETIAVQIRTSIDLPTLRLLWERHKTLHSDLVASVEAETAKIKQATEKPSIAQITNKSSCTGEQKFVHYKYTTQESFNKLKTGSPSGKCYQEGVVEPVQPTDPVQSSGLQHVKIGIAVNAASQRFRDHLPQDPNWIDVIEAAAKIRRDLEISQKNWAEACQTLGRAGAALCVLVTDQACLREESAVRKPAAYFRGMLNRATEGELRLHKSIFGLLKQNSPSVVLIEGHLS